MTNRDATTAFEERTALYAGAVVLVAILLAAFVWVVYAPPNPWTPQWTTWQQQSFKQALPQGWAFFTKSQRDEYFVMYQQVAGTWRQVFAGPQSQPRNAFGWLRTPRAQGIEMALLANALPAKAYVKCSDAVVDCLRKLPHITKVTDPNVHPLICGPTVLMWRMPIPWNWATFSHVTVHSRVAYMNVVCHA